MERYLGFPARAVAAEEGAVFTDHFRFVPGVGSRQMFERDIATLRPGVTELHLHPAVDSAELRSLATDDWEARVDDHRIICDEDWVRRCARRGRGHPHRLPAAARAGPGRGLSRSVTASTTTTIRGVSIFSRQRKRNGDVFDIALSPEGIAIRRPGRAEQHMAWERISEWEIEERPGCVVLTLRGGGSVTPLMVKGWASTTSRPSCARRPRAPAVPDHRRRPAGRRRLRAGERVGRFGRSRAAAAASPAPRAARRQAARRPRRASGDGRDRCAARRAWPPQWC